MLNVMQLAVNLHRNLRGDLGIAAYNYSRVPFPCVGNDFDDKCFRRSFCTAKTEIERIMK